MERDMSDAIDPMAVRVRPVRIRHLVTTLAACHDTKNLLSPRHVMKFASCGFKIKWLAMRVNGDACERVYCSYSSTINSLAMLPLLAFAVFAAAWRRN